MIHLAKSMKNLESFVNVSTAYSNCDIDQIEEKIYQQTVDPKALIGVCKTISKEKVNLKELSNVFIGSKPNTYTFAKALAENLVQSEAKNLPIAIIRPSIVTASWQEPSPGDSKYQYLIF